MTAKRINKLVQLGLLTAIVILMAFTPLGYLRTAGLELTFIMIPVIVGAILLGPGAGALLGGVFGLTSFVQCFGMSPFGATLLEINPIWTFIVCLIPRVLAGWLCGVVFRVVRRFWFDKGGLVSLSAASLCGPLLNTIFFMSGIVLFFYNTEYIQSLVQALGAGNALIFVFLFVGVNGLVELIVCFVIATAICKALSRFLLKREENPEGSPE